MDVEIDILPSPSRSFFISVGIRDGEAISFDRTGQKARMIKQVLVGRVPFPVDKEPTAEWDAVTVNNRKVVYSHVKWISLSKERDWVTPDEIWEMTWEHNLSTKDEERLLYFSRLFSDNCENLNSFDEEFSAFEDFLRTLIAQAGE